MKYLKFIIIFLFIGCSRVTKSDWVNDSQSQVVDTLKSSLDNFTKIKKQLLQIFDEKELHTQQGEGYRFIYFDPSKEKFDGSELYEVQSENGEYRLKFKKLNNNPNILEQKYILTLNEWLELKKEIDASYFWSLDSIHPGPTGLSEKLWILEGISSDKIYTANKSYHLVLRWNPHDGSFRSACLKFKALIKN
jgi:hypothetical protein